MKSIISIISEQYSVDAESARNILKELSFLEYVNLLEAPIIPPSGKPVGASTQSQQPTKKEPSSNTGSAQTPMWQGGQAPVTVGMMVGIGAEDNVLPGQVTSVDQAAHGVKVKDPTTGKEQWKNIDDLETVQQDTVSEDIARIKQLAGISEDASAGAVSSGSIATSTHPFTGVVSRKRTEEAALKREHVRSTPSKSIIGDTKPNQASGELSANLAASGKRTTRRKNNGLN